MKLICDNCEKHTIMPNGPFNDWYASAKDFYEEHECCGKADEPEWPDEVYLYKASGQVFHSWISPELPNQCRYIPAEPAEARIAELEQQLAARPDIDAATEAVCKAAMAWPPKHGTDAWLALRNAIAGAIDREATIAKHFADKGIPCEDHIADVSKKVEPTHADKLYELVRAGWWYDRDSESRYQFYRGGDDATYWCDNLNTAIDEAWAMHKEATDDP